jgi:pyridoxal phosphate enzyme (YggS family)
VHQGLADNLSAVQQRIAAACARSGRASPEVTLLAVTKVFPASAILAAYDLGLRQFGENYVQEFSAKAPLVRELPGACFHFIGHLQSNKSRPAAELFDVIQTIDSPKLARRLDESGKPIDVMIEVKLSPEDSKHGCLPQDLPPLIDAIRACPSLRLTGLMTMPPWSDDPELSRPYFRRLSELAQVHHLSHLSMGMSHDLEVAIEEGSTMVRIGTALFGSRKGLL